MRSDDDSSDHLKELGGQKVGEVKKLGLGRVCYTWLMSCKESQKSERGKANLWDTDGAALAEGTGPAKNRGRACLGLMPDTRRQGKEGRQGRDSTLKRHGAAIARGTG
jgi:hypothetical protein